MATAQTDVPRRWSDCGAPSCTVSEPEDGDTPDLNAAADDASSAAARPTAHEDRLDGAATENALLIAAIIDYDFANRIPHTCIPLLLVTLTDRREAGAIDITAAMQREVDTLASSTAATPLQIWDKVSAKFYEATEADVAAFLPGPSNATLLLAAEELAGERRCGQDHSRAGAREGVVPDAVVGRSDRAGGPGGPRRRRQQRDHRLHGRPHGRQQRERHGDPSPARVLEHDIDLRAQQHQYPGSVSVQGGGSGWPSAQRGAAKGAGLSRCNVSQTYFLLRLLSKVGGSFGVSGDVRDHNHQLRDRPFTPTQETLPETERLCSLEAELHGKILSFSVL
ncbi:hypothetical protein ON010_g3438 [Phytophthora cinnamomi]|nr:hypothetical protein ON010_g3438 [Phytophthora cinnamomi]